MRIILIGCLAICCALIAAAEKKVVCYYGSWSVYRPGNGKFDVADINPHLCTHLIYTFMGIDESGKLKSLDTYLDLQEDWGRGNIRKFDSLKSINPKLKTLAAVGGWNEGSVKYSRMANDPAKRWNFITSARDFLLKHGFDGLDMDWEYPAQREGDTAVDKANFVTLLREIKQEFDKYGFLLTAAVASAEASAAQSYDIPQVSQYLDFINIMAYDLHGAWENTVGINAPMHAGPSDKTDTDKQLNVEASINYWLQQGAPASKLILGLPLYGRAFTLQDPSRTAPGSPSTGPGAAGPYTREAGMLGYNEICENFKQGGWTIQWEDSQKVPYAFKDRQWVGFDNEQSLDLKAKFANSKGLGGLMIWSIETDDFKGLCGQTYPLLRKINAAIRPGVPIPEVDNPVTDPPRGDGENGGNGGNGGGSGGNGGGGGNGGEGGGNTGGGGGDERCTVDGIFRDPNNCSAFYQCVSGYYYSFQCPPGLAFDLDIMNCNYQDQVVC